MNKEDWKIFQKNRNIPDEQKYISCFAPFNHMRINRLGHIAPCCFAGNNDRGGAEDTLQIWNKEKGLHDYWFNGLNVEYQKAFMNSELYKGCDMCKRRIEKHILPPINDYDWNVEDRMKGVMSISYPKILEFEISNLCNMECPMCFGHLSSKHAANRDKDIDWGESLFDNDENLDRLIEEFKEFIPHLEEIRFVGGEPLAHKAMFRIAKIVADVKPEIRLQICTNASVYNKKVERLCKDNNIQFSLSLDTVIPEEYNKIRIGGKFKSTYSNVDKIEKLVGRNNITINTTLMSVNAENIIKFFKYGLKNGYKMFVNTLSLRGNDEEIDWWLFQRANAPDWGLHLVPFDIKWKVIKQCKELLKKDLDQNYKKELNKVIILLS